MKKNLSRYIASIQFVIMKFIGKIFSLIKGLITKKPPPLAAPWRADTLLKEKLTLEDAKFIFDQAEKFLNDSVATSETIVSRMNTLIVLISGLLIALITFDISKLNSAKIFDKDLLTSLIGTLYLYILAAYSFHNSQPKDYIVAGSLPKDLFNPLFFSSSIEGKDRILRYYVSEAENYQQRIEINSEINETRWKIYSRISKYLLFLPFVLLLSRYLLSLR